MSPYLLRRYACVQLLKGYKIQFFGRPQNPEYGHAVKSLALQKGIRVSFHGEVSKEELAAHMCQAQVCGWHPHTNLCACHLLACHASLQPGLIGCGGQSDRASCALSTVPPQGIIMFSQDKNPRSVYEGVQAGLPVFVSEEAQVGALGALDTWVTLPRR